MSYSLSRRFQRGFIALCLLDNDFASSIVHRGIGNCRLPRGRTQSLTHLGLMQQSDVVVLSLSREREIGLASFFMA